MLKRSAQVQCNYNTTAIQEFFLVLQLYGTCADPCNTTLQYYFSIQPAENLQATCSSCKKTCIAVVLRLCGLLQYKKIVLCYCSFTVVVLHLCGPLHGIRKTRTYRRLTYNQRLMTLIVIVIEDAENYEMKTDGNEAVGGRHDVDDSS